MMLLPALMLSAQTFNYDWKLHPNFSSSGIQSIVDTKSKVYYLVSGCLYCYDKASAATSNLTTTGGMHDVTPIALYQDEATGMVAVVYNTANIDLIRPGGEIANFAAIKDLVLTSSVAKEVNDINFVGDKAYVACSFGYVVFNTATMSDIQSHILYTNVQSVTTVGNHFVLTYTNESKSYIYYGDAAKEYDVITSMTRATSSSSTADPVAGKIKALSDDVFIMATAKTIRRGVFGVDESDNTTLTLTTLVSGLTVNDLQVTPTGLLVNCLSNSCYYTIEGDGTVATKVAGGAQMYSCAPDGDGTLWAIGANGLHQNGSSDYALPSAVGITIYAMHLAYDPVSGKMYVSRGADNGWIHTTTNGTIEVYAYDGLSWANATPKNGTANIRNSGGGCYRMAFIPGKAEYYMAGRANLGLYRIVNDAWKQTFTTGNANGALKLWGGIPEVDSKGNLWIVQGSDTYSSFKDKDYPTFYYITADNLAKETIANADIVGISSPKLGSVAFKRNIFTIGKDDIKVACGGDFGDKVVIWSSNDDLSTKDSRTSASFVDQDNVAFTWTYCYSLSHDNEGLVWLGCNQGAVYFDPTEAFGTDFHVNRVKLTDANGNVTGTLLDGIQVNCVASDAANRKWIGTNTEGVTVLSADNKTVIKQFSASNSPLPSNAIYDIKYHPGRNSMFILTSQGIAECFIDMAPASENYDNTYVFPDPVRPDYTGWIEIKNLMSNSLVTIKNAAGEVVGEVTAQGGRAIWDGCDADGVRLPTGVYTVFAAPDSETEPVKVGRVKIIK